MPTEQHHRSHENRYLPRKKFLYILSNFRINTTTLACPRIIYVFTTRAMEKITRFYLFLLISHGNLHLSNKILICIVKTTYKQI